MEFNIASPVSQLMVFSIAFVLLSIASLLNTSVIVYGGVFGLLVWCLIASIVGVSLSVAWGYYLTLAGCLAVGYGLLWGGAWLAENWGKGARGYGFMLIMIPAAMMPAMLVLALIGKAIWHAMKG